MEAITRTHATPHARRGIAAMLAAAGLGAITYIAARPWRPEADPTTFADPAWPLSHLAAMGTFTLVAAASTELSRECSPGLRLAIRTSAWSSVALLLPYYGAEAFSLNSLGRAGTQDAVIASRLPDIAEGIRMGSLQVATFGVGWIALGALGVLTAIAVGRAQSGRATSASAWLLAAGLASYLPVFYTPDWARIAHGVITGGSALALAALLGRSQR